MKVSIATCSGRFDLLDLACELNRTGEDVSFFSYAPTWHAGRHGLPTRCHRSLFPRMFPLLGLSRFGPRSLYEPTQRLILESMDRLVEARLEPCDFFVAMSGSFPRSIRKAQSRYGAQVWIHRAGFHIQDQKEILEAIPGQARQVSDFTLRRELEDYETADRIVVPSRNVQESLVRRGISASKILLNPYGVNLNLFRPTPKPQAARPTLLFVGTWCYRKGCDLLAAALERLPHTLLIHVGAIGDCPLPQSERFQHVDSVPEWSLPEYYAQAHVLTLPSREDGFGLVLSQGLACGLTLVASRATGGRDLLEMTDDRERVRLVPPGDLEALVLELRGALDIALHGPQERTLPEKTGKRLSWERFADVYRGELSRSFRGKTLAEVQA